MSQEQVIIKIRPVDNVSNESEEYDPTPYCGWCGVKNDADCKCKPRAEND